MITRDCDAFLDHARTLAPDFGPATARAAFLVAPEGFALAEQSAADNHYMAAAAAFDPRRALAQHRFEHIAVRPFGFRAAHSARLGISCQIRRLEQFGGGCEDPRIDHQVAGRRQRDRRQPFAHAFGPGIVAADEALARWPGGLHAWVAAGAARSRLLDALGADGDG